MIVSEKITNYVEIYYKLKYKDLFMNHIFVSESEATVSYRIVTPI